METKIGEIITINGVSYRIEIAPDESPCEGCAGSSPVLATNILEI